MTDSSKSELLLAHAQGLRRLARAVLRDAQEVEDALQETWAVAFERAPSGLVAPGAWLRQVLRGVVHKRLRGTERRERREAVVARPERADDTAELVARGEVLGRVVDAVRALDEPLREVVLLRHFEGLPPREIAERTGATVPAVNGRLRRAHGRLRRELGEDEETNWLAGLALCFGLDRHGPVAIGLAAGTLAMTTTLLMKLGAGASVLTAAVLLWPTDVAPALEAPPAPTRDVPRLASVRESIPPLPRFGGRTSVFDAPFLDEGPREFRLRVRAFDADDLPRHGARLYLAPPECEANLVALTDEDGWAEVSWIGRHAVMEVDWSLGSGLEGTHPRRVSMAAGRTYEVSAALLRADELDGATSTEPSRRRKERARRPARFDPGARCLDEAPVARRDEDGFLRFRSDVLAPRIEDHTETSREETSGELEERRYDWTISGQVLHEDGTPAADVLVGFGSRLSALERTRTDADGWYSVGGMDDAALVLFAGGGDDPHETQRFDVRVGEHHDWNPILEGGVRLDGSIRFLDGRPASDWLVQVESTTRGTSFADTARTDEDGVFHVPDCPASKLRVRARRLTRRAPRPGSNRPACSRPPGTCPSSCSTNTLRASACPDRAHAPFASCASSTRTAARSAGCAPPTAAGASTVCRPVPTTSSRSPERAASSRPGRSTSSRKRRSRSTPGSCPSPPASSSAACRGARRTSSSSNASTVPSASTSP